MRRNQILVPHEPKHEVEEVIAIDKAQQKDKRIMKLIEGDDFFITPLKNTNMS